MAVNTFEIEINASIDKVWTAITNTEQVSAWMPNIKVETNWQKGSDITYTCYDENGNVFQWNGIDMIWNGCIEIIEEHKEFTCKYPSQSGGLIQESYLLQPIHSEKTLFKQVQTLVSQEIADGYKEGTAHTLELLKRYLEG